MAPLMPKDKNVRPARGHDPSKKSHHPAKPTASRSKRHSPQPSTPSTPPPKSKTDKQSKITKTKKKVTFSPPSPPKTKTKHKVKRTPDHPLFVEYAESSTLYRDTCISSASAALLKTHEELKQRLNTVTSQHTATLQKQDEQIQRQGLLLPLAEEMLEITRTINGVRTKSNITLGASMTAWAATLAAEESNVRELLKQLSSTEREIGTLSEELAATRGSGESREGDGMVSAPKAASGGIRKQVQEWEHELDSKIEKLREEARSEGEKTIELLEREEAAEKSRAKQQNQALLLFLQTTQEI